RLRSFPVSANPCSLSHPIRVTFHHSVHNHRWKSHKTKIPDPFYRTNDERPPRKKPKAKRQRPTASTISQFPNFSLTCHNSTRKNDASKIVSKRCFCYLTILPSAISEYRQPEWRARHRSGKPQGKNAE